MSEKNDNVDDDGTPLLDEYVLSLELLADGEPARCVVATSSSSSSGAGAGVELLTGSQGGVISRIVLPPSHNNNRHHDGDTTMDDVSSSSSTREGGGPTLDVQPGGPGTRHPHQIAVILPSPPGMMLSSRAAAFYVTGCRDGNVRVMDGATHELMFVLGGHANAVTSLSWIEGGGGGGVGGGNAVPWLVSGSWDGTARVWSLGNDAIGSRCLCVLDGHENTVSVAGLPPEDAMSSSTSSSRRVVTVSAGVADGTRIRGHAVRIWRLTPQEDDYDDGAATTTTTAVRSELIARVSDDHDGPIRDVVYDRDSGYVYTCSNDGTVKARADADGSCVFTLVHPCVGGGGGGGGREDPPILLSLCVVGVDADARAVVAGAEDGSAVVWDTSNNRVEAQVIVHPGCVWGVSPLVGSSDFVTACHDGRIRVFTRRPSRAAPDSVRSSFHKAAEESRAARSSGPSPEEITKLPAWETNALVRGKSEGQVQVFRRDGRAIAAQWSAASGTWIEVGEVTGTNANAGTLDGRRYDHVLPIEIDVPGGGVRTLRIGYNDGENPFVTAQAFIDEHALDQGYLAQIADYIRQRAGETGPTLGAGGGGGAPVPPSAPAFAGGTPAFDHLPMRGYKIFDAGVDKNGLGKVLSKIREFNDDVPTDQKLVPSEANDLLNTLSTTLSVTNRYHASTISDAELAIIHKMITRWDAKHAFPALDLARATALHPDATGPKRRVYWEEVLRGALDLCLGLGDRLVEEVAVPMLSMRLIANSYKGGSGSADAAGGMIDRILKCANACALSNNKNVRLSVVTAVLNTSSYVHSSSTSPSSSSATLLLDVIGTIVGCGKYESDPIVRSLVALGTVLLLQGGCGIEMKRVAKERNIGSMVERVANGHGDMAKAIAKDITEILS